MFAFDVFEKKILWKSLNKKENKVSIVLSTLSCAKFVLILKKSHCFLSAKYIIWNLFEVTDYNVEEL